MSNNSIIESPAYRALQLVTDGQPVLARDILVESFAADPVANFTAGRIANMIDLLEVMPEGKQAWTESIKDGLRRLAFQI